MIRICNLSASKLTNLQELTGNWRPLNAQGEIAPTQELGYAAYNIQKIEGLKVPSARSDSAYNLVIFPDRLSPASFLKIYNNSGTVIAQIPHVF